MLTYRGRRITPARAYQRRDDPVRALADGAYKPVQAAFHVALGDLSEMMPPEDTLLWMLRTGQQAAVKDVIHWNRFGEALKTPFRKLGELHHKAGDLGARKINGAFHRRGRKFRFKKTGSHFDKADRFGFDVFDARTQEKIRRTQDELIAELTQQGRDTVDGIITGATRTGLGPEDVLGDIREMIGLTRQQAQAVQNYRAMLTDLDSGALRRQLRNGDYDDVIRDAISSGRDLDDAFIDARVSEYEDNYLDYRAGTLAQTETVRAANVGLHDAYEQAIDRGDFPTEAVRRQWQVDLDERTCVVCLSIPDMNPDGVPVGQDFQSVEGPQDDPPIHPNCRCSVDYVTDLDLVPTDDT